MVYLWVSLRLIYHCFRRNSYSKSTKNTQEVNLIHFGLDFCVLLCISASASRFVDRFPFWTAWSRYPRRISRACWGCVEGKCFFGAFWKPFWGLSGFVAARIGSLRRNHRFGWNYLTSWPSAWFYTPSSSLSSSEISDSTLYKNSSL